MNLLHLDSSILGQNSASRQLSASIVARLEAANPNFSIRYRDLVAEPIPHLSSAHLAATTGAKIDADGTVQKALSLGEEVLDEFLQADVVVAGVAFYNFTVPSQLKAWVDRILVNGRTFRYGEAGPQGLAGGKKVVLAVTRGGYYGAGSPSASLEHAESYLRGIFGFIGVTDVQVVIAEGLNVGPAERELAMASAAQQIAKLNV
ncbi:FMN-dependent NADH-azoreductase [Paraburkholderia steynii]|uniref:FMN dependent NADH:quinone oxidoreductase n=1 Tax=Paraburkholderia steynii TaxID=1245441 RepID=A0A4R0XBZ7_9BURK|nr:FMN-dependent NADH-azoreductase [Paraburkholderia steynii]